MRSTTRFLGGTLLGVALGVALGFLFFQKPARKVWEDSVSFVPGVGLPAGHRHTAVL